MMGTPRETHVLGAVVTLVDSLLDDFDVVELLTDLTEQCARLLDVRAAGLLLAGPRHDLHLMAATSKRSHDLEVFQLQADEGPCLDCYTTGQPVSAPNLEAEKGRWPRFVAAAAAAGFMSVHAVPMRAAGSVLGTLGLFGAHVGSLDTADLLVAHTLVHVACVAILQEHSPTPITVIPSLHAALTDRVVVDQATGFVSERLGLSMEEAFTLLRRYAQTHPEHLTDAARYLMAHPEERASILAALADLALRS
ncbi:GAF and ANTAR domain-containing protein [Mycolicibacterium sphagni]|uniref:Transcriptional regulator n=1 Tax=Mycolicibacterium sphagni TaxID=1786 RepID=A0A255DJD0_9MYCO|nr:GAF and ANTAR domain-containing protein [Mycolicibacterium sphagni]OYN77062.1 transcriptional regulator [Mycolicibacterium sphagni]